MVLARICAPTLAGIISMSPGSSWNPTRQVPSLTRSMDVIRPTSTPRSLTSPPTRRPWPQCANSADASTPDCPILPVRNRPVITTAPSAMAIASTPISACRSLTILVPPSSACVVLARYPNRVLYSPHERRHHEVQDVHHDDRGSDRLAHGDSDTGGSTCCPVAVIAMDERDGDREDPRLDQRIEDVGRR